MEQLEVFRTAAANIRGIVEDSNNDYLTKNLVALQNCAEKAKSTLQECKKYQFATKILDNYL